MCSRTMFCQNVAVARHPRAVFSQAVVKEYLEEGVYGVLLGGNNSIYPEKRVEVENKGKTEGGGNDVDGCIMC